MKKCSLCGKYITLNNKNIIGVQDLEDLRDYDLILFNCSCGSTLSVKDTDIMIQSNANLKAYILALPKNVRISKGRTGWNKKELIH